MPYEEDYKMWLEEALISMNPDWVCDGMYDTEFTHDWCSKYCGKDSSYITPKCLHMYYHHIERADRKTEPTISKMEQVDEPQRDCLEQFRVGLEYHTDTTHFGKAKGENVTTNKIEDAPQTCEECEHWSDTEDGCADRHGCKTEPQTDCVKVGKWYSFTDYVVEMQGDNKPKEFRIVPQTDCAWK